MKGSELLWRKDIILVSFSCRVIIWKTKRKVSW